MPRNELDQKLRFLGLSLHGLALAATLAFGAAVYLLVLSPYAAGTRACTAQTRKLQRVLRRQERLKAQHDQLAAELQSARQKSASLEKSIPDQPQEADFLAQLSQLADHTALEIQDYRPGVITPQKTYSTIEVQLRARGSYASVCQFLDGLEHLPRHSTVTQLAIEPETEPDTYSISLGLHLYFANPPPSTAPKEE